MIYAASVVPVTLIILAVINAFLHGPYGVVRPIIQITRASVRAQAKAKASGEQSIAA